MQHCVAPGHFQGCQVPVICTGFAPVSLGTVRLYLIEIKEIKQYQEKWLQHIQRMDTDRIPKQALQYKPKGRRNIGRPRNRWRDQLHLEDQ